MMNLLILSTGTISEAADGAGLGGAATARTTGLATAVDAEEGSTVE